MDLFHARVNNDHYGTFQDKSQKEATHLNNVSM